MSELEDKIKMELLEKLMGEMDDSVGSRLKEKKSPVALDIEIEKSPLIESEDGEDSEGGMSEMLMGSDEDCSPEEKLKRRFEAIRKKG